MCTHPEPYTLYEPEKEKRWKIWLRGERSESERKRICKRKNKREREREEKRRVHERIK